MKNALRGTENLGRLMVGAATTVLVVEDDPTLAGLLQEVIAEERGWQVLLASSGEQALRIVQQSQPHLFLFDNNLSGAMTGLDLFDCLRQQEQYAAVPTILMSAYLPPWDALQSRGVVGVQKPYDLDELLVCISDAVGWDSPCIA